MEKQYVSCEEGNGFVNISNNFRFKRIKPPSLGYHNENLKYVCVIT
jgi:hypothetical protein